MDSDIWLYKHSSNPFSPHFSPSLLNVMALHQDRTVPEKKKRVYRYNPDKSHANYLRRKQRLKEEQERRDLAMVAARSIAASPPTASEQISENTGSSPPPPLVADLPPSPPLIIFMEPLDEAADSIPAADSPPQAKLLEELQAELAKARDENQQARHSLPMHGMHGTTPSPPSCYTSRCVLDAPYVHMRSTC